VDCWNKWDEAEEEEAPCTCREAAARRQDGMGSKDKEHDDNRDARDCAIL